MFSKLQFANKNKVILRFLSFIALFFLLGVVFSQDSKVYAATNLPTTISVSDTWTVSGSPYYLTANTTINSGVVITVDPGVTISSNGSYTLNVNGVLDVNGTSGQPVIFTHTTLTNYASWGGIYVSNTGIVYLDYAQVLYSRIGVNINGGRSIVNDTLFSTNRVGINVYNVGSVTTTNNTFIKNQYFGFSKNLDTYVNLGTGSNADVMGTSTEANGYNAIGLDFQDSGIGSGTNNNCIGNICTLEQESFAGVDNIPYVALATMTCGGSDDSIVIDPGVIIKFRGTTRFIVSDGAVLDINGTSGEPVIFTSYRDDFYRGDINNDGFTTGTIGDWAGFELRSGTNNTIDYAIIKYAYHGVALYDLSDIGSKLTVNDSWFDNNRVGLAGYERSELITRRNTFTNQVQTPVSINFDMELVDFGENTNKDILGVGSDSNGFDAIGIGYSDSGYGDLNSDYCISDICTLSQDSFSTSTNAVYVLLSRYNFQGTNDTLIIDPGIIIKNRPDVYLTIRNGSQIDINGTSGEPVVFTSYRDDYYGGDTNNDGVTSGTTRDWGGLVLSSGTNNTIDRAVFKYAYHGVALYDVSDIGSKLTINDSWFDRNNVGLAGYERSELITRRNIFTLQTLTPVSINFDMELVDFGEGDDKDILGIGTESNGFDGIGIGFSDSGFGDLNTNNCLSDTCTLSKDSFSTSTNATYILLSRYNFLGTNDILVIDPGIIVKGRPTMTLTIADGSNIDINGTSGEPVIFTSHRDDSSGGDTNNDGSSSGSVHDWGGLILNSGTNNAIDSTVFKYGYFGVGVSDASNLGTKLNVNNSLFDNNNVGIMAYERSELITRKNTFTNQMLTPVSINIDMELVDFGEGDNKDILGTGEDSNGFDAVGIGFSDSGYGDSNTGNCIDNDCLLTHDSFAHYPDVTYVLLNGYTVNGSDDVFEIDPGINVKVRANSTIYISNGAVADFNGSSTDPIIFTSYRDDSIGGDTNNDSTSTGVYRDWNGFIISGSNQHNLDFVDIRYCVTCLNISATNFNLTDSNITYSETGIYLNTTVSPVFTRVNIAHNSLWGMNNNNTATIINAENIWWGSNNGPLDNDAGGIGYNATGTGNPVRDTSVYRIDYEPWSTQEFNPPGKLIINVESNLKVVKSIDTNIDVSETPQIGDIELKVFNRLSNNRIASFIVNFEDNRDWNGVSGLTLVQNPMYDAVYEDRSYFHYSEGFENIPGVVGSSYSLYIPKGQGNRVGICPGAESISFNQDSCDGLYFLDEYSPNVTVVTEGSVVYWKISGLDGTGGFTAYEYAVNDFVLTPNISEMAYTQEVNMSYTAGWLYEPGDEVGIEWEIGSLGSISSSCATSTIDADSDGTTDGSATTTGNIYSYTFTASTTRASVSFCANVTATSTMGSYAVIMTDSYNEYGAALYYVGGDGEMNIVANVAPTLSFNIVDVDDLGDKNDCNFGSVTTQTLPPNYDSTIDSNRGECGYGLAVGTNAQDGFSTYLKADGALRTSDSSVLDIITGTTFSTGSEAYGLVNITVGSTGRSTTTGQYTESFTRVSPFTEVSSGMRIPTSTSELYRFGDGVQYVQGTDSFDVTKVIHGIVIGAGTPAGMYQQVVTYTVVPRF